MSPSQILLISVLLGVTLYSQQVVGQAAINCQRPPQLVDPALCCKDGGRDQVADQCAQKILGAGNGQKPAGPPSLETAACLAECILTTSNYIEGSQKLQLENIRSDLSAKFSNDSGFVEAMTMAYSKCEPQSQRRLAVIMQQLQQQQPQQQQRCSPFSAIVLGCTYMEYFKNCPDHRWTQNAECALAKAYVTQCGLGA
ncbi:uncharacterized protein Obp47b [Drosophila bipectinata]|uniref:uncharacterized protein Obp47b n=1 Tax=Drosophila bipectinata TaxID=42026 RepID=UPI001C8AC20A|nr:uncharacterized protein LOC108131530 [Drosophila bipectinata]KAH8321492.1 hypothetical protein KR074_006397 [Drosophila pseudoananassae]